MNKYQVRIVIRMCKELERKSTSRFVLIMMMMMMGREYSRTLEHVSRLRTNKLTTNSRYVQIFINLNLTTQTYHPVLNLTTFPEEKRRPPELIPWIAWAMSSLVHNILDYHKHDVIHIKAFELPPNSASHYSKYSSLTFSKSSSSASESSPSFPSFNSISSTSLFNFLQSQVRSLPCLLHWTFILSSNNKTPRK